MFLFLLSLVFPGYELVDHNVFERNLVNTELSRTLLISESGKVCKRVNESRYASKNIESVTFITPWNADGYNLTIEFGGKFTAIFPVWFQAKRVGNNYEIHGMDAVNEDWLNQMKQRHPRVRICPRLNFEIPVDDFEQNHKKISAALKKQLVQLVKKYNFGGIFLEFPVYLSRYGSIIGVTSMGKEIRKAFPKKAKIYIEVPADDKFHYGTGAAGQLVRDLINTYDYTFVSLYEFPMETTLSPLKAATNLQQWSQKLGLNKKIIMGLPLFGFDYSKYGQKHVFGEDVLRIASERSKSVIKWNDKPSEHGLFYNDNTQHVIYYPSLFYLHDRIEKSVSYGFAGFGFWELAQGLPYFFDLL